MLNRTAYFVSTGHVQDHFNRQTIDTKCTHTVQVRPAQYCHTAADTELAMCCLTRSCQIFWCMLHTKQIACW